MSFDWMSRLGVRRVLPTNTDVNVSRVTEIHKQKLETTMQSVSASANLSFLPSTIERLGACGLDSDESFLKGGKYQFATCFTTEQALGDSCTGRHRKEACDRVSTDTGCPMRSCLV